VLPAGSPSNAMHDLCDCKHLGRVRTDLAGVASPADAIDHRPSSEPSRVAIRWYAKPDDLPVWYETRPMCVRSVHVRLAGGAHWPSPTPFASPRYPLKGSLRRCPDRPPTIPWAASRLLLLHVIRLRPDEGCNVHARVIPLFNLSQKLEVSSPIGATSCIPHLVSRIMQPFVVRLPLPLRSASVAHGVPSKAQCTMRAALA